MSGKGFRLPDMKPIASVLAIASLTMTVAAGANTPPAEAVKQYRSHMFDAPVRTLANRTIAEMFNTAPVRASGKPRRLPVKLAALDFTYTVDGKNHPATDVIENTFVDGLLIIKSGVIVYEGYYNRSGPETHYNSYSMAKSINAVMIGLAIKQGLISSVDDQVTRYIPELKGTGYDHTQSDGDALGHCLGRKLLQAGHFVLQRTCRLLGRGKGALHGCGIADYA
jgi:CubicO group peptidase (beta-lactamase class C family)